VVAVKECYGSFMCGLFYAYCTCVGFYFVFRKVCIFVTNSECRDHLRTSSHHGVTEAHPVASGRNY